jgi:hypothetical protein
MRRRCKLLSLMLGIIMVLGINSNVFAAETYDWVGEDQSLAIQDIMGLELTDGQSVSVGDITVVYHESVTKDITFLRASPVTNTWTKTSSYDVFFTGTGQNQRWYSLEQKTNFTYDMNTIKINTGSCNFKITSYYTDCQSTVTSNMIDNTNNTAATYTVQYSLKLGSVTEKFKDVVTMYPNGTGSFQHYEM